MKKLGIEKHQYALKHTGADDKILAGVPLEALRDLYGHSSKLMTEKYARIWKILTSAKIAWNVATVSLKYLQRILR